MPKISPPFGVETRAKGSPEVPPSPTPCTELSGRRPLVMDALDVLATSLTQLRNTLPPISQLPTEILCEIFAWMPLETPVKDMTTRPTFEHLPQFLPLRLVCKEWDATVTANQQLWTCIQSIKESTKWIDLCLARSGSLPLTVKKYLTRDKIDHEPFLESITPHMARSTELEIVLPEFTSKRRADYLISTLLEACSPSLRILRINDAAYVDLSLLKVEIGTHITGLQELKMQKLPFPSVDPISFRSLRRLILHSPQDSLDNLIPSLSYCPSLCYLDLYHDCREVQEDFSRIPESIELPSLTYFRSTDLPVLAVARVLGRIRMPMLRTLILTYKGYEGQPGVYKAGGVLKALAPLLPGPITSMELLLETMMAIQSSNMVVVLDQGSYRWHEFLRWMVKHSAPPAPSDPPLRRYGEPQHTQSTPRSRPSHRRAPPAQQSEGRCLQR